MYSVKVEGKFELDISKHWILTFLERRIFRLPIEEAYCLNRAVPRLPSFPFFYVRMCVCTCVCARARVHVRACISCPRNSVPLTCFVRISYFRTFLFHLVWTCTLSLCCFTTWSQSSFQFPRSPFSPCSAVPLQSNVVCIYVTVSLTL
jgi:hypothetical protein